MTDDGQDVWWEEFEQLGEEEVRKHLGAHIWGEEKERLARQWLELGEAVKALENRRKTLALVREVNDLARRANDVAKEANDTARTNNIIATFALFLAGIAIGVSIIGLFLKSG